MTTLFFRDVEQLSAFLDGQLSQAEKARLESRLKADPALAAVLEDLRSARAILRRTPRRRVPRNFTLTPRMAGIKPPVPRLVPALSWASALAMLLFVFTLGGNLMGRLSFGSSAPMMAAAPNGMSDSSVQEYGIGGGPPAENTLLPESAIQATPTPEVATFQAPASTSIPDPTAMPAARTNDTSSVPKNSTPPINPWYFIWPGLAGVLLGSALLIRWAEVKKFRSKAKIQK